MLINYGNFILPLIEGESYFVILIMSDWVAPSPQQSLGNMYHLEPCFWLLSFDLPDTKKRVQLGNCVFTLLLFWHSRQSILRGSNYKSMRGCSPKNPRSCLQKQHKSKMFQHFLCQQSALTMKAFKGFVMWTIIL